MVRFGLHDFGVGDVASSTTVHGVLLTLEVLTYWPVRIDTCDCCAGSFFDGWTGGCELSL